MLTLERANFLLPPKSNENERLLPKDSVGGMDQQQKFQCALGRNHTGAEAKTLVSSGWGLEQWEAAMKAQGTLFHLLFFSFIKVINFASLFLHLYFFVFAYSFLFPFLALSSAKLKDYTSIYCYS